jgi:hypothetical protein
MSAPRSVVSVLLRALGDFSLHPQGRPLRAATEEPASPSRQVIPRTLNAAISNALGLPDSEEQETKRQAWRWP